MKEETRKENLLRRLKENREFYYKTGRMSMTSFLEELADYIDPEYKLTELNPKK